MSVKQIVVGALITTMFVLTSIHVAARMPGDGDELAGQRRLEKLQQKSGKQQEEQNLQNEKKQEVEKQQQQEQDPNSLQDAQNNAIRQLREEYEHPGPSIRQPDPFVKDYQDPVWEFDLEKLPLYNEDLPPETELLPPATASYSLPPVTKKQWTTPRHSSRYRRHINVKKGGIASLTLKLRKWKEV